MLYRGSAISAVGFLGNLWWQPEQTLILLCNRVRVNGLKGDGKQVMSVLIIGMQEEQQSD